MKLRTIADGEIITEPGAYRMSIDWYHRQCCDGPSISSSGLRTIELRSPMDFWAFSDLNPDRWQRPETDALSLGRAAHAILLGEEAFEESFAVVPEDAPQRPTKPMLVAASEGRISDAYKKRQAFWGPFDAALNGRTIVSEEQIDQIVQMSAALGRHPLVGPLFQGDGEVSLIWRDEQTGVWLKARPDMIPAMGDVRADLKTIHDAALRACLRHIREHGYHMQGALTDLGLEAITGEKPQGSWVLVFIQKTPPYHVTPIEITEDALHWGAVRLRRAVNTFARCMETGDWPGPVEGIPKFDLAEWEVEQLGAEQKAGVLPHDFWTGFGAKGEAA